MTRNYLNDFCSTNSDVYLSAEDELAEMREGAIPILLAFLSCSARNGAGIPYRVTSGHPIRCVFATIFRLGSVAKPLESLLREELKEGDWMCAKALTALGSLDDETIDALSACLLNPATSLAWNAAEGLIKMGYADHRSFLASYSLLSEMNTIASDRLLSFIDRTVESK